MKKGILLMSSLLVLGGFLPLPATVSYAEDKVEVYKESKFSHEIEDDIDVFTTRETTSLKEDGYTKAFLYNVTKFMKEHHKDFEDFKNGVIFVDKVKAKDHDGKETEINSIILWISPESLEKIDYSDESWGGDPKEIYELSDSVFLKSEIQTEDFQPKTGNEDAPDAYFMKTIEGY